MIWQWLVRLSDLYAYNAAGIAAGLLVGILVLQVAIEAFGGKIKQSMGGILYLAILPLLMLLGITAMLRVIGILRSLFI